MDQHRIIPFYQAFQMPSYMMPGYVPYMMPQEDNATQDLQYLQEILPEASRRYAKRISDVVDRLDYKGSMIYDEFPDRMRLQRLTEEILRMIEADEAAMEKGKNDGAELPIDRSTKGELIFVLLVYEIYKRRHGASRMDLAPFYGTTF